MIPGKPGVGATKKPVMFILPTFLAVGGVERNTVEVISRLRDTYDFVVVTFERLSEGHGSLHHQFLEHCVAIYDLAELGPQSDIPLYLEKLRDAYRPDLVWICNGCPWLAANTALFRSIFHEASIIDQQVYDTDAGWVQLFRAHDPGLLSFDRFIAINSRIYDLYVDELGISRERVDLVYHVFSTEKRTKALLQDRDALYRKFGLDPRLRYFASIGRLAEQKAPLDFLALVDALVVSGHRDLRFLMIGDGEMAPEVEAFIRDRNLGQYVQRFPYIENVLEICLLIDAVIFTSHFEGLPIALLETLSVGTPGLCTDVGDIRIVFEKFGNGMIFEGPRSAESFKASFLEFLDRYDDLKASAMAVRDTLTDEFSLGSLEAYRACFQRALEVGAR